MSLRGLVVLVTGGASGLGLGTVRRLSREGAKVTLCDLESSSLKSMDLGNNVAVVPMDVTKEEDVTRALRITKDKFGRLDVAVNCAGIYIPYSFGGGKNSLDDFVKVLMVNTVGAFNVTRLCAGMIGSNEPDADGQRGVIINTASVAAFEGRRGGAAYAASKAGVVAMTLPIARDLASQGIRCNAIAPGMFDTQMMATLTQNKALDLARREVPNPRRLGDSDEFASLVQHIITNKMINGETVRIDGALRMPA